MKKRILTVLIAILTVIPLVLVTPKATSTIQKYDTFTTDYGSYSYTITKSTDQIEFGFEQWGFSIPFPEGSTITFEYNFKKAYSGRFDLLITNNTSWVWNSCYVMVDGGYFETPLPTKNTATTGKTFKIHVNNTDHIVVTFISASSTLFNANTSISVSANYLVDGVELSDIDTTLDLYLPGMSTSLSNIDSDLDNISQNIQALSPYIDQLEGLLSHTNSSLISLLQNDIFLNAPIWQYSTILWAFNQCNGNIELSNGITSYTNLSSYNDGQYTNGRAFRVPAHGSVVLYIGSITPLIPANVYVYYSYYDSNISVSIYNYTTATHPNIYYNLIRVDNSSDYNTSVELELPANMILFPFYLGSPLNVPDDIRNLYSEDYDNTYTRLLKSINNGIGALNDDYDTSAYDNYEQTLDGLNDGLRGRFDNVDNNMQTNVDTLFTPSGTAGSDGSIFEKFHFNAVNSFMSGFINRIFVTFPAFKYILIFGLLLLVIGVMI